MKTSGASLQTAVCRILLINENRHGLIARKAVLEQAGYSVAIADNADAGLAQFECGEYELVITSYRMASMNGSELIARVRAIKPETRTMVITGFAEVLGLNEQNTGADVVIPKSAHEVSHLLRAVNRLLRSKTPRKPPAVQCGRAGAVRVNAVTLG